MASKIFQDLIVDNEKFDVYELDNKSSIINRISHNYNTLPEYIHIDFSKKKDKDIANVTNLIKLMDEYKGSDLFEEFYEKYKDTFPHLKFEDFASLWYIYSIKEEKDENRFNPYIDLTVDEAFSKLGNTTLQRIKQDIDSFKTKFNDKRKRLKKKVESELIQYKKFSKLKSVHSTEVEILKIKTEVIFEVDYDIYELFNNLNISRDIPFISINEYYKILKEFKPPDKWSYGIEEYEDFGIKDLKKKVKGDGLSYNIDILYLKVLNTKNEPLYNMKNTKAELYSTVAIFFEYKKKNINKVYMRIESSINPDLSKDDLIKRIINSFPSYIQKNENEEEEEEENEEIINGIKIKSKTEIQIKGEFLIPNFYLDQPIFNDMVLNDDIISKICFIDERFKILKEKGGIYLYFAFNPEDAVESNSELISCSLTEQIVEKTNLKIIAKDKKLIVDTPYLKVRITKAKNLETAERFKSIFTKIIKLYIENKDDIIKKYSEYISNFEKTLKNLRSEIEKKRKKSTRTSDMMKDINPELFIYGYSRFVCPKIRNPTILGEKEQVDKEKINEMEENGQQTMLFPKTAEEGKQYYYTCNSKKYKYIALTHNKLKGNYDKYPVVPCCFAIDHRIKKNSLWRQYYEENKTFNYFKKNKGIDKQNERHILKTNKILNAKQYGLLIDNIDLYFKTVDNNFGYMRKGVERSYNSVIEVLLMAMDNKFEIYKKNEIKEKVNDIRKEFINMVKNSDIYQESYIYTAETIQNYLKDPYKYLDPKLFIRLLEDYFNCYIFIFSQNILHPYGILSSPYHIREYLKLKKDPEKKTVFIYEHTGTEHDKAEYPQCELIIQKESENDKEVEINFGSKYEIVKRTNDIFKQMYFTDNNDNVTINFITKIIGQGIDFYGKCRFLQFNNNICILTDPLPPLNKIEQKYKYQMIRKEEVEEFLKTEKIKNYDYYIINGKTIGVNAVKDNVKIYIPIIPEITTKINKIENVITPTFIMDKSMLSIYNNYNRIARYLTEYLLYLFSLYYKNVSNEKEEEVKITPKLIKKFFESNVKIDENFKYKDIKRIFSLKEEGILNDKKLVVNNLLMKKKLVYILRIRLKNNIEEVKNYSDYKYIQQYYADIKDFKTNENQLILYGKHALVKWIESIKPVYQLYDSIQHSGVSLLSELSTYDESKLFILIFTSTWSRPAKSLLNKIYNTSKFKDEEDEKQKDLYTRYNDKFNFIYIDINANKSISSTYNISHVPTILFMKIEDNKLIELARIIGTPDTYKTLKLINTEINKLLD